MTFHGLQKMTLLDYPGLVACTVFTGGCNFKCPFCHNALLVTGLGDAENITEEEVLSFLGKRTGLLDGVCITGGEPLLCPDITDFIKKVKALGFKVKLDTNGSFPDRLKEIVNSRLVDYVAVDIKNCAEKYAETAGVADFDPAAVSESIDFLMTNPVEHEFRTTVVREFHGTQDIEKIAKRIEGEKKYFLQNFEDSGGTIVQNLHAVSPETLEEMRVCASEYIPDVKIRGL